jgi:ankyrin repeat protein
MKSLLPRIWFWLAVSLFSVGCTSQRNVDLVDAALTGDLPKVQALLKEGASVEATAFDGLTPLDAAAKQGHLEVLKYLIEAGASINGGAHNDRTALGTAIVYEHTDCAKFLISRGGEIRGTQAWKQGLLSALKRDNRMDLYEVAKEQIVKEGGASEPLSQQGR